MRFLLLLSAFILTGCGLINGDKVTFGQSFPASDLRGKTYYITNREDYSLVLYLKAEVIRTQGENGWVENGPKGNATKLRRVLENYSPGWLGWF